MILVLLACTASKDTDTTETGSSGLFESVEVRLSTGVSTVLIASWSLGETAESEWIEYGVDTNYGQVAPARAAGEGIVLGLTAETTVHVRIGAVVDGAEVYSDDQVVTTGSLPSGVVSGHVTSDAGEAFGNYFVGSFFAAGQGVTSVVVLNRDGEVVWYTEPESGMILAARPALDGTGIRYLWEESPLATDDSRICLADFSGESTTCLATPNGHHDFRELADGSFVYPHQEIDTFESYDLVGDALVQHHPDGEVEEIWSAFDNIVPVYEVDWDRMMTPNGVDWTHTNGVWQDGDAWYMSFLHFQAIYKIVGGETAWVLGGENSEFGVAGPDFGPQHAPMVYEGELWLYDNSAQGSDGSRVASYAVDASAMVATSTRDWTHPRGLRSATLGDVNPMGNGFVASSFGEVGEVIVWTADGEVAWSYGADSGTVACQVTVYDDLYSLGPG